VSLSGNFCQFGDYFLLLREIQSHITPPL